MNASDYGLTPKMISAAKALLLAMAMEQLVRTLVEQYEREILMRLQLRADKRYAGLGVDRVIVERVEVPLLSESDREIFYRETYKARDAAKLHVEHPEACPLLQAQLHRTRAEKGLIHTLKDHPKLSATAQTFESGLLTVDERKRVIDLTLALFAPFVGNAEELLKEMHTQISK
jgi:hypothetical protein